MKMIMYYRVLEHNEHKFYELGTLNFYDVADPTYQNILATECAQDFWDIHNSQNLSWPLTFALHKKDDGDEIVRFSVDMKLIPTFYERKINE